MALWEFILTKKNELIQLTDRIRQEIWDELKEEGKTDKEIVEIFMNFGF